MRIIAGKNKGLVLNTFSYDNIRPTIDRVKEAIFNKIQFDIVDSCVLDLFGGTGNISLEFASRGAEIVYTGESNKNSIKLIKQNFAKAKQKLNLIENDYLIVLNRLKDIKFDFIFLDPPFESDYILKTLDFIKQNNMLSKDGIIICEYLYNKDLIVPEYFEVIDSRKYGTVGVKYLMVNND